MSLEQRNREFDFNTDDFRFLAKLVNTKTGIMLPEHKQNMMYSRVARRLRALGMTTFKEYCAFVESKKGESELVELVNAMTTNLTKFFRESHHFDHLKEQVLTPLLTAGGNRRVRLWSAGCSAGMEPYSIAMTACDALQEARGWDLRILATDIDTNMLDHGKAGIYKAKDVAEIPKHYQKRYTVPVKGDKDHAKMADRLRELIAFKELNLLENWPMRGGFDAAFCRNVVIYFDKDTQRVLFDRMADMIKPGGYLYIGHSENLMGVTDRFRLQGRTVYQRVS